MKLDNNVLSLLIDKKVVRFISQPDKEGFSKAVVVSPFSNVYTLEKVSNLKPSNYLTSNNVILNGVNKEYKTVMAYLEANKYEAM